MTTFGSIAAVMPRLVGQPLTGVSEADIGPPTVEASDADRHYRLFEYVALFFILPGLIAVNPQFIPFLALLYSAAVICLALLLTDRTFDRGRLWNRAAVRPAMPGVLALWIVGVVVMTVLVSSLAPAQFLDLPRARPGLWLAIMVLYPLISVYPQNVIYRAFIFHRYRGVFRTPTAMIWASAAAFSWGHVIFHNAVALMLTFAGGLVFAHTYGRYRSTLLASIEHALYGCLVFSVGLGGYLVQAVQR